MGLLKSDSWREAVKRSDLNKKIVVLLKMGLSDYTANATGIKIITLIDEYMEANQRDVGEDLLRAFKGAVLNAKKEADKALEVKMCRECVDIDEEKELPIDDFKPSLKPYCNHYADEPCLGDVPDCRPKKREVKYDTQGYGLGPKGGRTLEQGTPMPEAPIKKEMAGMIEPKECPSCGGSPYHKEFCGLAHQLGRYRTA